MCQFKGVIHEAKERYKKASSNVYRKNAEKLMSKTICPDCQGARIKAYSNAAKINNKTLFEICNLSIEKAFSFFQTIKLNTKEKKIASDLVNEIKNRLLFLLNVGLNYVTLNRTAPTLSGGEAQRVKLAAQLGCGLVGTTYILDEPSIGLHPQDHHKLIDTIVNLRDKKNTVIVIEHDADTIKAADEIIDIGPLAGKLGGQIIAQGSLSDIKKAKNSLTGQYFTNKLKMQASYQRKLSSFITLKKANLHNLKNIDVQFPMHGLVLITGVSGSGKSTLISETLYPALNEALHKQKKDTDHSVNRHLENANLINKVILIDQSSIGKTARSNPATYTKILDEIRILFASTKEA